MKNEFKRSKHLMVVGLLVIAVSAAAWQNIDRTKSKKDTTSYNNNYSTGDTTEPRQRDNDKDEPRVKDLDDVMKELDVQLENLKVQMKDLHIQISDEVRNALTSVDLDKINKQIEQEMKNIDFNKIKVDVDKSLKEAQEEMKKVDMEKIKVEVEKSLKEAQQEMKKVDMEKIKEQMEEVKKNFNNDKFKQQMEEAMKGAKESIEKAKKEIQQMKDFTNELQQDGLIDKKRGYSIEWKNGGELYINGNKQSKEISDKYRKYYKKDGFKLKMNADGEFEEDDKEGEAL